MSDRLLKAKNKIKEMNTKLESNKKEKLKIELKELKDSNSNRMLILEKSYEIYLNYMEK